MGAVYLVGFSGRLKSAARQRGELARALSPAPAMPLE
jgi:hypothetical protein